MLPARPAQKRSSELSAALARCRHALIGIGVFTAAINLLQLTGPLFMLEVYDRVLPGRSVPTLVAISILALAMFAFQGLLDVLRSRVLVRIAASVDETLSQRVFDLATKLPLKAITPPSFQPVHDLDRIRSFMSTVGPAAFFDLPWMPLYLGICFIFHPLIGWAATVGGLILIGITIATEFLTRQPSREAASVADGRMGLAEASRRNAEVVQAMGMSTRLNALWHDHNRRNIAAHQRVADISGGMAALSRILRMVLQSAVLGIGAWLVINQQATAGIIIASSILTSRALAPVEVTLAHWRSFISARQSWRRLNGLLVRRTGRAIAHGPAAAQGDADDRSGRHQPARHQPHRRAGCRLPAQGWPGAGRSDPARRASRRWCGRSWACGLPSRARSASTAPPSTSGRPRRSARMSATCRRTWSCSQAASPKHRALRA